MPAEIPSSSVINSMEVPQNVKPRILVLITFSTFETVQYWSGFIAVFTWCYRFFFVRTIFNTVKSFSLSYNKVFTGIKEASDSELFQLIIYTSQWPEELIFRQNGFGSGQELRTIWYFLLFRRTGLSGIRPWSNGLVWHQSAEPANSDDKTCGKVL